MDLDLLQIKLTAYALGELEAAQKADIERILTESQDARDQVARAKSIAKGIKELLPQSSDDVQPMTPAEYRARWQMPGAAPVAESEAPAAQEYAPAAPAASGQPTPASNSLVWLLAAVCAVLAAGWLWQWKNSSNQPQQKMVAASEVEAKEARIKALAEQLGRSGDDLAKERAGRAEQESKNAALEQAKMLADAAISQLDGEKKSLESKNASLESDLIRTLSASLARHQPFVQTSAQLIATLPPTAANGTLARIQAALTDGEWPMPNLVDTAELVQSFAYHYPAPAPGQKLPALASALAVCPWNEKHILARVTLTAGTEAVTLSSLQLEFNPAKVAAWRMIGREAPLSVEAAAQAGDSAVAGGQGCGELKPGSSITILCELAPATDPLAPLAARRADLLQKIEDAKRAIAAAKDQTSLINAKLAADGLRLELADLDGQIAKTQGAQKNSWRYLTPAQPTAAAGMGDWLAVTGSVVVPGGQASAIEGVLRGQAKPFPEADADFRLAASAATLGLVLHGSPDRGTADLTLVEALLKDLPKDGADVKTLADIAAKAARVAAENQQHKAEEPTP